LNLVPAHAYGPVRAALPHLGTRLAFVVGAVAAGKPMDPQAQQQTSAPKVIEIMQKAILLMDADPLGSAGLLALLSGEDYETQKVGSLSELRHKLEGEKFMAVLMDIDSVAVDNRAIRELAAAFPATPFLCISRDRVHPELKDAIRNHIYACLTKPVDMDEITYWLRCIREDQL
jgi:CheY-like chemotaxis protein